MHATPDDAPTTVPDGMNDGEPPTVTFTIPHELRVLFMDNGQFVPDMWWWSFDTFLTALVEIAARKLRVDGHGYPGDTTQDEWNAYLQGIEDDLAGYDKFASTATVEQYEKVQAAMRRLVDRMANWWD